MSVLENYVDLEAVMQSRILPEGIIPATFNTKLVSAEWATIRRYYGIYRLGCDFQSEGGGGSYVPTSLRYRLVGTIIDKEARFFASTPPDFNVSSAKSDANEAQEVLNAVLVNNNFTDQMIKGAKDCFVGKRLAFVVDKDENGEVYVTCYPSLNFISETVNGKLTKFCTFVKSNNGTIVRRYYSLQANGVLFKESWFDGAGKNEELTVDTVLPLPFIPAVVIINDGLTGEEYGESEVESLKDYEAMYSKLNSSDIDAERKSMNPIKYTVDMDNNSTKDLSTGAGAFWDLMTDQNLENTSPSVGMLEPSMSYSSTLQSTLDRLKSTAFEQVDMPNISLESLQGTITSGKALRALYWSLIIRCKEKMAVWKPALQKLAKIILNFSGFDETLYDVDVVQVLSLPEDNEDEKTLDIQEVNAQLMSRKAYMKKWRYLSDEEIEEELKQMAKEREILNDTALFSGF